MSFPYPVRALRVRLLVAPADWGWLMSFCPFAGHFSHRPPVYPKDPKTTNQELRDQIAM
jgi:hypothetical protein